MRMKRQTASLDRGFYTMREAVGLIVLDVPDATSSRLRPLFGSTKLYPPAIDSSRSYDGRVRDISFHDLIELRFVAHFRQQGVTQQGIRVMAKHAREVFGSRPFARGDILWRTDGRRIYSSAASESGDRRLLELANKQYELEVIEESLRVGMDWDAKQFAISWRPRPKKFPNIVVDPRLSFGRPSIANRGISIEMIYDVVQAEDGDMKKVAAWYAIPVSEVREAVSFQKQMLM